MSPFSKAVSLQHFYLTMGQSVGKTRYQKSECHDLTSLPSLQTTLNKDGVFVSPENCMLHSPSKGDGFPNVASTVANGSVSSERSTVEDFQPSNSGVTSDLSNTGSNRSDSSVNIIDEGPVHGSLDFEPYFQEGYCQATVARESCNSVEAVGDGDNARSPSRQDKSEEDVDNDDMLEGIFAFSEEGILLLNFGMFSATDVSC